MVERKAKPESKFAGIFAQATPTEVEEIAIRAETTELAEKAADRMETAIASRPLGRPPGKRSDPAWKQYSVLLKRATQREAADILRAKDEGQDFSALVQHLLEGWIKEQR